MVPSLPLSTPVLHLGFPLLPSSSHPQRSHCFALYLLAPRRLRPLVRSYLVPTSTFPLLQRRSSPLPSRTNRRQPNVSDPWLLAGCFGYQRFSTVSAVPASEPQHANCSAAGTTSTTSAASAATTTIVSSSTSESPWGDESRQSEDVAGDRPTGTGP